MSLQQKPSTGDKGLKYGIVEFTPLLVNPTRTELNEFLNIKGEGKIEYNKPAGKTEEGVDFPETVRIDIWGETNLKRKECIAFYLTNQEIESKTGKKQWINGQGISQWSTPEQINANPAVSSWYCTENMRPCLKGEENIVQFFIKLLNIYTKYTAGADSCPSTFIDTEALFKGDFKELQAAVNQKKHVELYQGIIQKDVKGEMKYVTYLYPYMVLNPKQKINEPAILAVLTNEFGGFKRNITDWNISKELKTFSETPVQEGLPF